jgi:transposase InsO family protein
MKRLARRHPRYGYRRIHALLLRAGWSVNLKRVRRLWISLAWIPTQPKLLTKLAQVYLYDSVAIARIPWKKRRSEIRPAGIAIALC